MTRTTIRTAPLTPAQTEVLDAWRLDPTSPVFRVADLVEITGDTDVEALATAIGATLADTQALHWQVVEGPDGWHQEHTGVVTAVEVRDVRAVADPVGTAQAWIDADLAVDDGGFGDAQVVWRISDDRIWWYQRYHHVRVDGWAVAAITRRAVRHYRSITTGASAPEPFGELEAAWADDAAWTSSDAARSAAAWFATHLDGAVPTPIAGRTSPAGGRPHRRTVPLDATAAEALTALTAADRRITWADVLVAAHAAWVGRTTARDDVVIALPMTARTGPAAVVPSMTVNVVPVRLAVPLAASLHELALEAGRTLSSLRRHQRLRGGGVTDADLLRGPAVNIKPFVEPLDLGGPTGHLRALETGPVDDLDLVVVPDPDGGLALTFEANPDLHDEDDLERHATAFATFLAGALSDPERPTGQVPLAAPTREPGAGRLVEPLDVSTRLKRTVAATPGLVAVRSDADAVTFAELGSRVDAWARVLAGAGAGPETVVAIALERGIDVVTAILATLEAGAAFVPIDLAYPDERVDDLLDDTRPIAVLTRPQHRLAARPQALTVVDHALHGAAATDLDPSRHHGDAIAYVVHTSGSTGRPKGVMVSRDSLAFFSTHHGEGLFAEVATAAGRRLRAAHTASFSFDSSWEQLVWLLHGHELVVYGEDDRRDAHELVRAIDRDRIDTLDVTPSMAVALLAEGLLDVDHVPQLFLIGGEAATEQLWRALADAPMRSHNFYGPTEATVDALGAAVVGDRPTIGGPLDGTAALVLDRALQPVPDGSVGELHLAGPHLARGYAGRAALTAERFVADPRGGGTRMYRTGDLARREADGTVTYLGRADDQVKIRGHRIELGEVVAALESLPEVRQAHAAATGDPARLVAWAAAPGADAADIRAALAARVPAHLVPAVVMVVDVFSQTVQGKIDVRALPEPGLVEGEHVEPADERETAVVSAMAAALGLDRVSATADFFTIGGDSISAISVAAHLRTAGWQSRPRDLFRARTARDLAPELAASTASVVVTDDPVGRAPLSPVAAATIALAGEHLAAHAQHTLLRVPAGVTDDELASMLGVLVGRHASLRVRLEGDALVFGPAGDGTVAIVSGTDRVALLDALLATLDPRAGLVVAAGRVPTGDVVLVVHHLAVDGVSWRVLLAELAALLAGRELPPVAPTSWRAHLDAVAARDHTADLAHWASVRDTDDRGAALAPSTTDVAGTAVRDTVTVDAATSGAVLDRLPASHGTRPDVVLAAAAALAVDRWAGPVAGERSVLLGWETVGREPASPRHDVARTVGWLTEDFTVAVRLAAGADAASALKSTQQGRLEVPSEGRGHHLAPSTPRVLVNYLGRFAASDELLVDDLPFATHVPAGFALAHGIELNVFVASDGRLAVEWTVAASLAGHVRALQAAFAEALAELAALVDRPVGGTLVPAASTLPGIDQAAIDAVEREHGPLLDIAPLPPLAEGLLVHALGGDDVYETLTTVHLGGPVDELRLRAAIAAVTARHPQLDARVVADRFARPVQLVPREPRVEIVPADAVDAPFDVTRGPLTRWAVVSAADGVDVLIGAHHLVADGWSTPLLVRDLLAAYRGTDLGTPGSGWATMRRYLQLLLDDDVPAARRAWATHLDGVRAGSLIAPGATTSAPPVQRPVDLPADLADRLGTRLRSTGLTLSSALGTAWAYALGRALGTTDVVFGTTVAGRSADVAGISDVVGLLSQTLPVRIRLRGDDTWRTAIARTGLERAELGEVERTSLTDIADAAGVPDLFDTLVVVENYPEIVDTEQDVRLLGIGNAGGTHYPLTVTALPGAGLRLVLDVDAARVPDAVADRVAADLVLALTRIADDVDGAVGAAGAPHPVDARRGPDVDAVPDPLAVFVDAVARRGDEPAVLATSGSLTFADLAARAEALRRVLADAGVRPGDLVGIALPRTADLLVAVLGVLAGGHAYLPLDPEHPAQRRRDTVADARPVVVITGQDGTWLDGLAPIVGLPAAGSGEPLTVVPVPPTSAAYVIHTSGSTGRPKGVVVERGSMARHLAGLRAQRDRDVLPDVQARRGRDRVHALLSASLSFDTSVGQLHWLFAGHTLVLADTDERRDPVAIADLARAFGLDVADVAPILGEQLVETGLLDGPDRLSLLYLGGEAVPAATWHRLRAATSWVVNLYGPTESTVDALGAELAAADTPVIGRPVAGVEEHVLDGFLRPVADGVEGELYLGGDQLARGYLGRPGLTAERFVAHPWAAGRRLYRTGDVVRRRPDGLVEFVGRSDDQVKIGGHRIELGEVTSLVAAVAGVSTAVVLADPPGPVAERLIAFVVAAGSVDLLPERVRDDLAAQVPHHLVPSAVVVLDALPRTVNDKIDLGRLRAIDVAEVDRGPAALPPSTPAEIAVAGAVRSVLGVTQPSMDDDFFALGGHSLTALRMLAAMRAAGFALGVRDVFDQRRLDRIATAARAVVSVDAVPSADADALRRLLRDGGTAGVSDAQRRLLFLAEVEGPAPTWNVPVVHRVRGPVDADRLRAAWSTLTDRHAVLRTRFSGSAAGSAGRFAAEVQPLGRGPTATVRSVHDLDAAVVRAESEAFDVFAAPPVRLSLLSAGPSDHALVLCGHHALLDDWSVGVLVTELGVLMAGDTLEPLPDHAQHVADHLSVDAPTTPDPAHAAFWSSTLDGLAAEIDLPTDRPRPEQPTYTAHAVTLPLDDALRSDLRAITGRDGLSPLMVLQTAVATLLRGLGAGPDICLGMPVARRDGDRAATVGYLVDTVPVRLDVSGADDVASLAARTRDAVLSAVDHADLAFERIVEIVAPPRSWSRHPVFQVMVSAEDGGAATLRLPGAVVTAAAPLTETARLDLAIRLVESADAAPHVQLTAAADLFDPTTVDRLARRLLAWLRVVAARPDVSLAELDLLLDDERDRATADHVRRDVAPDGVMQRFAAQVRATPDAPALVAGTERLDYRTLADRAAALTEHLRGEGVGTDDVVAVAVPRSADLVVALLGILGAGATYLPLDDGYPAERIADMLDDADPRLVVVTPATAGLAGGRRELDVTELPVRPVAPASDVLDVPAGDHGAYTIYTSGSTGRPKGVVIPTSAMAAFVDHVANDLRLVPTDRFVAVTTISFDIAVLEIFVPLVSGAAVALADAAEVRDPDLLVALLRSVGGTHVQATPSLWRPVIDAHPDAFAGVTALVGGEALPPDLADLMTSACSVVLNEYGPTEATVWATSSDVTVARGRGEPVTIGRPYLDVGVLVLDDLLRPVPDGVPGELYLAGAQLARGYHDRFALTAERFTARPGGRPGERMYRTGDLVRRDAEGRLHFVRRVDDQVKVLGHRIELGEVETHLGRLPGVDVAAAVVRVDEGGTGRLLGYVVADGSAELDPAALRALLGTRVPAQLVPQHLTVVDDLPLTLNGKIDRSRLPDPVVTTSSAGRGPADEAERIVCEAAADVLGLAAVGPADAFFELGGDSITSIRLVAAARTAGLRITPRDVFTHPDLAGLAAAGELLTVPAGDHTAPATTPDASRRRPRRTRVALGADDLARIDRLMGGPR